MAYGKRYSGRKSSRRGFKSRGTVLRRNTYKAVKRIVNKTLTKRTELKFRDTAINFGGTTYEGQAAPLNIIPRGTANTSRVGERIKSKYLRITGIMNCPPNSGSEINTAYATVVRLMVVYWRNLNGSIAFTPDRILATSDVPAAVWTPKDYNNNREWEVLADRKFTLAATPSAIVSGSTPLPAGFGFTPKKYFEMSMPVSHTVQYNSAELDEELENNPSDGTYFLFAVTDQGDADFGVNITGTARYFFYDN